MAKFSRALTEQLGGVWFTATHARILRLLAGGVTQQDIAQQLGVSHATIQYHVLKIIGRVGCQSRSQLDQWMAEYDVASVPGREDAADRENRP